MVASKLAQVEEAGAPTATRRGIRDHLPGKEWRTPCPPRAVRERSRTPPSRSAPHPSQTTDAPRLTRRRTQVFHVSVGWLRRTTVTPTGPGDPSRRPALYLAKEAGETASASDGSPRRAFGATCCIGSWAARDHTRDAGWSRQSPPSPAAAAPVAASASRHSSGTSSGPRSGSAMALPMRPITCSRPRRSTAPRGSAQLREGHVPGGGIPPR